MPVHHGPVAGRLHCSAEAFKIANFCERMAGLRRVDTWKKAPVQFEFIKSDQAPSEFAEYGTKKLPTPVDSGHKVQSLKNLKRSWNLTLKRLKRT